MKSIKLALILIAVVAAALLAVQRITLAQTTASPFDTLRVLSPQDGQKITQNFVAVKYEITNPARVASSVPTFLLRLDDRDPVSTASTEHTFTGLAPGQHTLMLEVVDANNTPIVGSRRIVRFTVVQSTQPSSSSPPLDSAKPELLGQLRPSDHPAKIQQATVADADEDNLPASGSTLPLLSVIGFGVLLGGIVSALRTR
ncbi:MAG: hypothetical protein ACE14M_14625 [Terriglobales bacterium]